ncbi:hypothetical protein [Shewanella sp. OMA3-2]|uniref:hypothetical protein n=1 Tax=Shewanella sp. OMA3-2 TaxID=2908650 RepID=UPI001F3E322C|nr:hypothetical protein [Shewanella sp. OMA3-2]UJF21816.1 hypothetical protein L0B17_17555 [Shewanella sp. OMA3-2]
MITPGKRSVISELEFELIEGESADLILLGLMVAEYIPLRLGQQSKALTGYLLSGRVPYQFNTTWPTELDNLINLAHICPETLKPVLKPLLQAGLKHWLQLESYLEYMTNLSDSKSHPQGDQHNKQLTDTSTRADLNPSTFEQLLHCIMVINQSMLQHKVISESLNQDILSLIELINSLSIDLKTRQNGTLELAEQTYPPLACIENLWQHKGYGKLQLALMQYLIG